MAHKKAQRACRGGRDSKAQNRGVKRFGGEVVNAGTIIVRQCGTRFKPGLNVGVGRDYTLYARVAGRIAFESGRRISVYPEEANISTPTAVATASNN